MAYAAAAMRDIVDMASEPFHLSDIAIQVNVIACAAEVGMNFGVHRRGLLLQAGGKPINVCVTLSIGGIGGAEDCNSYNSRQQVGSK